MQTFVSFLKSRQFYIQGGIILVLIFLIFFAVIKWLSSYTNHGEYVLVPDFKGQAIKGLDDFIKDKQVSYQVIDSIYDPREKPGVVLRQDPDPESKVKHNRTVYLYVTGMVAPRVQMPKLIDRSERQARLILSSYGLKAGKTTLRSADCNGCVMAQLINGREVEPGKPVKKGSVVELVIGKKDGYGSPSAGDSTETNAPPDFDADEDEK